MEWVEAFWEERALPSGVLGPVDFWALARLAARRWGVRVKTVDIVIGRVDLRGYSWIWVDGLDVVG
jgi:hypothetical protein